MLKFMLSVGLCLASLAGGPGGSRADEVAQPTHAASPQDRSWDAEFGAYASHAEALAAVKELRARGVADSWVVFKSAGWYVRVKY
jgi:hypothetical protein